MNVDAIIFDKDGTLIDFDAFWVTVSVKSIKDILKILDMTNIPVCEILAHLGVHNGVTDIDGVLCKGTYIQMGQIIYNILKKYGCNISCEETTKLVIDTYNKNADSGDIKPTCANLSEVLTTLKKQNKKLAVVTTDNQEITHKCLKTLGIEHIFDKIYTYDGKTPLKPAPYCANDFAEITGIKKERIVMVGDTITDTHFAKNAGIMMIGVAKNEKNKALLMPYTDVIISELSHLTDILN